MTGKATFVAYIDEAGQESLRLNSGTSRWFVLSSAVFRHETEIEQVKLVDEVRARINQGRKPDQQIPAKQRLHFRDLKHEARKFYANRIAQAEVKSVSIVFP